MLSDHIPTTFGDWSTLRYELLRAYEGPPGEPHREKPDYLTSMQAWLFRRGGVEVTTASGRATAGPGQWLFTTSQKTAHHFTDDAEIFSLTLRAQWPDDRLLFRHDPPVVLQAAAHAELERAVLPLLKFYRPMHRPELRWLYEADCDLQTYVDYRARMQRFLRVYVKAMQAAGVPMTQPRQMDARVQNAIRMIDRHNWRDTFDESHLAQSVGLSVSQMHRLFVAQLGTTAFAYYDRRRHQHAQQLLAHTNQPIKNVAYQLGFRQPAHFTRWFSKKQGRSPRSYRAQNDLYEQV